MSLMSAWAPLCGAQEIEIGMREYMQRCAACHGPRGSGDGPVATLLETPPPDLTLLAQRNDGVFPVDQVYQSIDGRREITAHGTSEMPLWGRYFSAEAVDRGASAGVDADQIVMGRILSIVYYLQAIQRT
jgi:mono/diheme cytochrome c family protein